jgi:hypothetical protein
MFVISRKHDKEDKFPTYWNETYASWSDDVAEATTFTWSWAHEVLTKNKLKEGNPGMIVEVERKPIA